MNAFSLLDGLANSWSGAIVAQGGAALVALAAVLGLRWAARAASPHFKSALLLLALMPLAMPLPQLPIPPLRLPSLRGSFRGPIETTVVQIGKGPMKASRLDATADPPATRPAAAAVAPTRPLPPIRLLTLAFCAWLVAVVALLARWFGREFDLRRRLRGARELTLGELGDVGLSGPGTPFGSVRVVESDALASPATIGFLRPTIVLPTKLRAALAPDEFRFVLLHELAHVQRGDLWTGAFERLLRIVWFFHPAPWIVGRLLEVERESACDDAALAAFPLRARHSCADAFLKVVELARSGPRLAVAAAMTREGRHVKSRLLRMVAPGRPLARRLSGPAWLALVACAAGLLVLLQPQRGLAASRPSLATRDPALADALVRSVDWLLEHQVPEQAAGQAPDPDAAGRWDSAATGGAAKNNVGVTGLALLALTQARPRVDDARGERIRTALARGSQWLASKQDAEGCIGARNQQHFIYGHAFATLALTEMQAADPLPARATQIEKALRFLVKARNPYGGWRYSARPDGDNDASVTGTIELVLGRALEAGFPIDATAIDDGLAFLDKLTDPETGRTGYQVRGSEPARTMEAYAKWPPAQSESLTAVALHARASHDRKLGADAMTQRGLALLAAKPPSWNDDPARIDFYYWFHGSAALRAAGGAAWPKWRQAARDALLPHQRRDGDATGSFDPDVDPWGSEGGRVYATAVNLLTLATVAAD